jgi:IS30 family transposase
MAAAAMRAWLADEIAEHLLAVEDEINKRPRMILDDHAPAELFGELLASPKQPSLRR